MALLEGSRTSRDILPPINHPDFEQGRSDKKDRPRFSVMPGLSISTAPLASPTTIYSGPPPPYSYAPSTTESVHPTSGYFSPPPSTTRRSIRDDKDLFSAKTLPSLPSLHEALGGDKPISFPGPPPATQQTAPTSAPATAIGQSFPDAPRGPLNPFSHITAPSLPNPNYSQPETYASKSVTAATFGSDHPPHVSQPYSSSPRISHNAHRSSVGSFSSVTRPFEVTTTNPSYSADTIQPPGGLRDYSVQSSIRQPQPPPTSFTFEPPAKIDTGRNPFIQNNAQPSYHETVKRSLEGFDAELALSEITDASTRTNDFSRSWLQRYQQSNRASCFSESAPNIQDIDEMMRQQHHILENLNRIREVVIMQQNALSEQRARAARSHMDDEYHGLHDEYKTGGFAGGDAKKRRGKAAPPGRCHSCNRAETPEWRRGPDGARTLCNACGLHYAKLTRKLGPNKAGAITGSSLRPKGLDSRPGHI